MRLIKPPQQDVEPWGDNQIADTNRARLRPVDPVEDILMREDAAIR